MKKLEASYTVEIALLLPVIWFVLITPVSMGYKMYKQTMEASVGGWETAFCAEKRVRMMNSAENILEEVK